MGEPLQVSVGDKLFVSARLTEGWIEIVERITPTGRIVTKRGHYDPDGWLRGAGDSWNRVSARKATEDDIAGIYRYGLVSKIEGFKRWEKLSADDLKMVAELVEKYKPAP